MKKIFVALVALGLGMEASGMSVDKGDSVIVADTLHTRMNMSLPTESVKQMLEGAQVSPELVSRLTAPGVENVNIAVMESDILYVLKSLGLSPELLQKDEAGQAKLNIGQALPQLMSLAGAFPGLVQLQMDPATKGMKMAVNNEVLKNVMSGIEVDPTKFIVSEDATGKNVKVEIDSENMRRIGDGLKAIVDKYKAQNGGAMQMSGDFGSLLQSLGGKVNISQKITDPVIVETTTDKVKLAYFVMNNSYWHVVVDVTDCKGKLKGVDKTGYFEVDGVKYPLKEVKEATIPASADEVMTWDKNTTTQLTFVFPPVKVTANSQMELVLSTAKNGVRIKTHFRTNR